MNRLSSSIEDIGNHYQVVIVGSGYGGSIAASRLARAGRQVCVLERGKEFLPGEFPDTEPEVVQEAQFDTPELHTGAKTGLYDFRVNRDINVFLGCGLGGTSLVNANVSLPPDRRVLEDPRWPAGFRADLDTLLAEGFARSQAMLRPKPYPDDFPALAKLEALERSAAALGGALSKPPINVTFEEGVNDAGVAQHPCILCGDCVTGCNHGAKNTLAMNYLPDAVNHGAEIFTQVSVRRVERKDDRWTIHYQVVDPGRELFEAPAMFLTADIVILAAGTLGTTEILLRSQAEGLSLSGQLGRRFTGNGDLLGFSYNGDRPIHGMGFGDRAPAGRTPVGPTIAGAIDLRGTSELEEGIIIEEGAVPGGIASLLPLGLSVLASTQGAYMGWSLQEFIAAKRRELESLTLGPHEGATKNTQTYLVMAHDDGEGRMALQDDRLRIAWPQSGSQPVFGRIHEALKKATEPLHGAYVSNPAANWFSQGLTTVHPLGGCVMAEDAAGGVVNHKGQVFADAAGAAVYDSLYVCDGAVIPRPLGVNPLLTISALAERCAALIARDRNWAIDYSVAPVAPRPAPARAMGVRFTESMRGFFSTAEKDDCQAGAARGKAEGSSFRFILTITAEDLDAMINEPEHAARMTGNAFAPALSPEPLTVTEGRFNLFVVNPDQVETRNMIYRMKLTSREGRTYFFHGIKIVKRDSGVDMMEDTTTLFITIHDGADADAPVLGKGVLVIPPDSLMRQLTTIEITNALSLAERLKATVRFGTFFMGPLFEIYGGVTAPNDFAPGAEPRKKRALRLDAPEVYPVLTGDGVEIRLTRYAGGSKGPVLLAPGYGTSTLAFTIDTVETNLPEFLFAHGFDVWLFDYRASPALASARTQFSLDEIAVHDYPAAVAKVRAVTGAESIQVLAHCVGSMTFLMAMLAGLTGVRAAICSALAFYPVSPDVNRVKAGLDVGSFLTVLGVKTLTTDMDPKKWEDQLLDAVLKLAPTKERCNSPICRRILMMYGETYKHDQLNAATHDAIHEMFGVANMTAFNHLALMVRKKKIVDRKGKDAYLPHVERLKIPLVFIHGAENGLFFIEGTKKTFQHLCEKNGPDLYQHMTFPHYAHMDMFIGRNAARDIFPALLGQLEVHA